MCVLSGWWYNLLREEEEGFGELILQISSALSHPAMLFQLKFVIQPYVHPFRAFQSEFFQVQQEEPIYSETKNRVSIFIII